MAEDPRYPFDKAEIRRRSDEWLAGWCLTDASLNDWVAEHGNRPGSLLWDIERLKFYWRRDVIDPLLRRLRRSPA